VSDQAITPITFPETLITEETFERQGWEKITEDESEGPAGHYFVLPLPKDNPSDDGPMLISSMNDEWQDIGLPEGSYVVEIEDFFGLGFCESEEQLEILYRSLTAQELED
jgi:hypothetical protein